MFGYATSMGRLFDRSTPSSRSHHIWLWLKTGVLSLPKKLITPVLVGAVALHGLILILPLPPTAAEEKKPAVKKEAVKIAKLSAARPQQPARQSRPARPKPPKPKPAANRPARPKVNRPKPKLVAAKPKPKPQPKPVSSPKPTGEQKTKPTTPPPSGSPPTGTAGSPPPAPVSTPPARPTPPPPANSRGAAGDAGKSGNDLISTLSTQLLTNLLASGTNDEQSLKAYMTSIPSEFISEDKLPAFIGPDGHLTAAALGSIAIPQMSARNAYESFIEPILTQNMGFKIKPVSPYGNSDLYEADNGAGVKFFFSMVKLTGSGAFLVIWEKQPT